MSKRAMLIVAGMMMVGSAVHADDMNNMQKAPAKSAAELTKIASSAAPPEVSKNATIIAIEDMTKPPRQIKAGTSGWVCAAMVMGPDKVDSMCVDKQWQAWVEAYMTKKDPPAATSVGVAYMLNGDLGVSNTDPYGYEKTADNHWVVSGPHIMLLFPDAKTLDAYPTDPNTGGPWVMWKGTKYQHVMVPVAAMPKQK
jgi:hypothetical protein